MEDAYLEYVSHITKFIQPFVPSVAVGEVANAYCPGKYDLHVNGMKIAGISQRRVRQGVSVHGYISVTGNEQTRLHMIREFYEKSQKKDCLEKYKWQFELKESAVTTLAAFTPEVTVSAVTAEILRQIPEHQQIEFNALDQELGYQTIVNGFTHKLKR
jgi:octanoyl-[GcvH]:protein N-octanoyltransferase